MAVVSSENRVENLVLCVEFISSLKVANLYVGFNEDKLKTDLKQVICERQSVTVILKSDEIGRTLSWTYPIHLLPNTCSRVTYLENGILVRCNFNDDSNDASLSENIFVPSYERIRCCFCGNDLMKRKSNPVTTRVPISALGLSKDFDWDQMSMSYFCHDHGCGGGGGDGEHNESDAPLSIKNTFGPQVTEYFDCETYLVFNEDVIDRTKMKISETELKIACLRCHKQIGETSLNGSILKLHCDAVTECDPFPHSLNDFCEMRILANILRSSCRRFLFVNEDGRSLSVVIMDKRLKMIRVPFEAETIDVKSVWKLLYKPNVMQAPSDVTKQSPAIDTLVKVVKIHPGLFVKFVNVLTKSTNQLPPPLRFADDYRIAYVPHC